MASLRIEAEQRARWGPETAILVLSVVVISGLSLAAFASHYHQQGIDDAWITYRYARNIAAGHGYVYNIGEAVQGTSTPLFTLWLAALGRLGFVIPSASTATAVAAVCATASLLFLWLRTSVSAVAGAIGVALLLTQKTYLDVATSGMETAPYIALLVAAFYMYDRRAYRLAFLFGGLAMLMRLDGACVVAALTLTYRQMQHRWPRAELLLALGINAPWFLFALIYFGSPLPNSFLAKQYHTGHQMFSSWMIGEITTLAPLYLLVAVVGVYWVVVTPRARPLLVMVLWWEGYIAAYSLAQLEEYIWYIPPMVLPLLFFAAYGAGQILAIGRTLPARRALLALVVCAVAVVPTARSTWAQFSATNDCGAEQARYAGARYAAAHVPKEVLIASSGIGMVGWFTNNYVIDDAGLVSPRTLAHYEMPYTYHSLEAIIQKYRPAYIYDAIEGPGGWPPAAPQQYHVAARFTHHCPFFTDFILWQRNHPAHHYVSRQRLHHLPH